jgi:hypothetical protein
VLGRAACTPGPHHQGELAPGPVGKTSLLRTDRHWFERIFSASHPLKPPKLDTKGEWGDGRLLVASGEPWAVGGSGAREWEGS